MTLNDKPSNIYNVFIISSDEKLLNTLVNLQEAGVSFMRKDSFELQEILTNVVKKVLDILIIDLDDMDSELLKNIVLNIKNRHQLEKLPLIVISSNCDIESRIQILNNGVDDFIEKPIILDEFLARINNVLRRCKKFTEEEILIADDIQINILNRRVEIRGKQIKISSKEFGILKLLAENYNKIFSRFDILNIVWNDQFGIKVNKRTIDVHINRLRVALGCNKSGDSYIRTVRGEGYSLHIDDYKDSKDYLINNYYNVDQTYYGFQNYLNKNQNFYDMKINQRHYLGEFDCLTQLS